MFFPSTVQFIQKPLIDQDESVLHIAIQIEFHGAIHSFVYDNPILSHLRGCDKYYNPRLKWGRKISHLIVVLCGYM